MLCKNKKCDKGNFGKRAKFEQTTPSHLYCCADCLLEDMKTEAYKKKVASEIKKESRKKDRETRIVVYEKENRKYLQDEINLLSRKIDAKCGYDTCIDCGKYMDREKHQIDACHLISRKKNSTLRYHLFNLHSGHNYCNTMNESHESSYKQGIVNRYGQEMLDYIESLPLLYKEIHLSAHDIADKLAIVRKLNREVDKMEFDNAIHARSVLNELIGIY